MASHKSQADWSGPLAEASLLGHMGLAWRVMGPAGLTEEQVYYFTA